MNSSNITHTHTHTQDVMYLIRGIYNPTSYIDERGKENPNELYQTFRPKRQPKVPEEQVNWHRGRCNQPNPDCGNLYRSNNLEAQGGGEQKGNLNNLCQPNVPYLILLQTEEGKKNPTVSTGYILMILKLIFMHKTIKWKWRRSVMSNSLWPHGL